MSAGAKRRRLGDTKRRAIVTLFLSGWSFVQVARLFRIRKADAEQVLRDHGNGGARR